MTALSPDGRNIKLEWILTDEGRENGGELWRKLELIYIFHTEVFINFSGQIPAVFSLSVKVRSPLTKDFNSHSTSDAESLT